MQISCVAISPLLKRVIMPYVEASIDSVPATPHILPLDTFSPIVYLNHDIYVWKRMLGNEGQQQDCYHGDEDASQVSRRDHMQNMKKFDAYYTFHRSTRLCAVAVFVYVGMPKEEIRTTSHAELWTWQYQVPDDENAPRRHGSTNMSRNTGLAWVLP